MALETLRANKLQSGLTVLGVVIGITSIVGVTSLIRGFDQSLRDSINELGPEHHLPDQVQRARARLGWRLRAIMRRPNLTVEDAKAIEKLAPSVDIVDIWLGAQGEIQERVFYQGQKTRALAVIGATEEFADVNFVKVAFGRFFTRAEVEHRRRVGRARAYGRTRRCSDRRASIRSASASGSAARNTRSSACSANGPRPAASTSARTTSSSFRRRRTRSCSTRARPGASAAAERADRHRAVRRGAARTGACARSRRSCASVTA